VRVIFMGTPEFAVPSLDGLAREHDVAAVYVRPDAASGRGGAARPAAVKLAAQALGLPVRQPASLREPAVHSELAELAADFVCVAAYGLILPPAVLSAARYGAVNVHASLLPRWRGAAPIQRAILAGDPVAGVSIMRMEEGLDTGPFCAQASVAVAEKNARLLTGELAEIGANLLLSALPSIADGSALWTPQSEDGVTYAEKVTKSDVAPDPALAVGQNVLRIRASTPAAPARTCINGRGMTLVEATALNLGIEGGPSLAPGGVLLAESGVLLGAAEGALLVTRVKPDGKAEMDAVAWARGARLGVDATWESVR
jgi:methionyl-tRNA formyltransferase